MRCIWTLIVVMVYGSWGAALIGGEPFPATWEPLVRVVDLDVGECADLTLCDGSPVTVELVALSEQRDSVCDAVRRAVVTVRVGAEKVELVAATYELPRTVGNVQIDCAVTSGYVRNVRGSQPWGLDKAARLRLWPAGSAWIRPGTFQYPVRQRWFASLTQMANVPVYVDGGELPGPRPIYYHSGLDFGGAEGLVDVVAATDGLVVAVGTNVVEGYDQDTPVRPRYDVVYVLDRRGWYYRYSHLYSIDPAVVPGQEIRRGAAIGVLGKEGASGGWSHTHFEIKSRQPSGRWGTQQAYAFAWEAYRNEYRPAMLAVARPHHVIRVNEQVTLDADKSWSATGPITDVTWLLPAGPVAARLLTRTYDRAGTYSEVVRVTDADGHVAYDFAEVQVYDPAHADQLPPTLHAAFAPTLGLRPGDDVTFKVRSFRTPSPASEVWDFGDGSPQVVVHSDGNRDARAKDGYAVTTHRYDKPGDYIVTVRTTNEHELTAEGHLFVRIETND